MFGTLYIVPTPIGNLRDITLRAIDVLKEVDLIACEDTRRTAKLLNHLDIKCKMISYFEHNKEKKGEIIIDILSQGRSVALVSDAGVPAISDPGEELVELCIKKGINIIPLPGACAFITGLVASGLSTKSFLFEGFLSVNKSIRSQRLKDLMEEQRTIIFYEAPHKLLRTLKDLYDYLGERKVVLARELTKIHEEFYRDKLSGSIKKYEGVKVKGEVVILLEGARINKRGVEELSNEDIAKKIDLLIKEGMGKNEAIKNVAKTHNLNKREVYKKYSEIGS